MTFILQMLKNPEVQRLAHLEIEEKVGSDRLPTFEDMENLLYVRGICEEVLRCVVAVQRKRQMYISITRNQIRRRGDIRYVQYFSVFCLSSPLTKSIAVPAHCTTEDDVYQGCQIPAGTVVLANAWYVARRSSRSNNITG